MTTTPKGTTMPGLPPPRAPITLECELTVNGRRCVVRSLVPRAAWEGDQEYRDYVISSLRRRLGEDVITALAPAIRVIEESPGGEALWARLMTETES